MQPPHDRELNSFLTGLCERLAVETTGSHLFGLDDFPQANEDIINYFLGMGLLTRAAPATHIICDGCDECCPMEVDTIPATAQTHCRASIICDKRADIGRVQVQLHRLDRWRISLDMVARFLARMLKIEQTHTMIQNDHALNLGTITRQRQKREVILCRTDTGLTMPEGAFLISLTQFHAQNFNTISLPRLISFQNGKIELNENVLTRPRSTIDPNMIVAEILYEAPYIQLLNHVTGKERQIANPNLDSINDKVFGLLYSNPDTEYSTDELERILKVNFSKSLHKILGDLHFTGTIKKAFFKAGNGKIRFSPKITYARCKALAIDPKKIS